MDAGDFDLAVDPETGHAYYYFEKVHTELICAELTDDYTDVTGDFSSHFPQPGPPFTREAPAHFVRDGTHYLITSGTTWYFPNPSELASAPTHHGPWTVLGNAHPDDVSRSSYRSQVSSVFRHPGKKDLYIALADRWLPQLPADTPNAFDASAAIARGEAEPHSQAAPPPEVLQAEMGENTAIADYVWLPIEFGGAVPVIRWHDEWRIEDFE